ncbi:MAG: DUF2069 domain-containing protein [Xanthomonadales bacterium]|nr:DUF2069 domain-containing protein [Xanthomonadales bacterium]NIX11749.1 DUF2069 domain-containing protein [Xanthomonadales bacterium]
MRTLLIACYLGLFAWQFAWHALLPEPAGSGNWLLATLLALPLLLPAGGVLRAQHAGMTWGAFLVVLYFLVGVMEAWSNPPQRFAALVQVALVAGYVLAAGVLSRRDPPGPG